MLVENLLENLYDYVAESEDKSSFTFKAFKNKTYSLFIRLAEPQTVQDKTLYFKQLITVQSSAV